MFSAGIRGKRRDDLVWTVRKFGGKDLKKRWEARADQKSDHCLTKKTDPEGL
jgi:hypothetical protein